jgi:hypothetical protein
MVFDINEIEMLHIFEITQVKQHHNGHHFTGRHPIGSVSFLIDICQLMFFHFFAKLKVEIINGNIYFGDLS